MNLRGVRVDVHGTVQGVGFRPYVYRLANLHGLRGDVRNVDGRVLIRAAGPAERITSFLHRLAIDAPPAAHVAGLSAVDVPAEDVPDGGFHIRGSATDGSGAAGSREMPADLATCPACLAELFDPADRRYRYPFINCTDCGPRATIVDDLPYDRERTTMARFGLCGDCAAEYRDPADRRFHAEPVACPRCGPQLWWRGPSTTAGGDALACAVAAIAHGGLVAVKGIGGYQLVCDAADDAAVARVRAVKHRPTKPLAVMVADLTAAATVAHVSPAGEAALTSTARPIVLLPRNGSGGFADGVCAGLPEVGLFLPYSPLHHLLLHALRRPLVVTSGNRSGEPIAVDDEVALTTLGPLVDGVLGHDRPIRSRYDDSVARVVAGRAVLIRRARGYAPAPLPLPVAAPEPILAVGAQLKHTTTVAVARQAVIGPHTGDLADEATHDAFTDTVDRLCRWRAVIPRVVAHDLHPGYLSTRYGMDRFAAPHRIAVQHHHAHVAAVAAEHGLSAPFLGVAYDGLGLGDDGTLWGGEILHASYTGYRRLARFARAPLPGGAAAVRRPARMALAYLYAAEDLGVPRPDPARAGDLPARLGAREAAIVRRMIDRGVNSPLASSCGRLFDAVAALLGLCDETTYEGEAAVRLEAAAGADSEVPALPWRVVRRDGLAVYDPAPTLRAIVERDRPAGWMAAAFHTTLAEVTCALVADAAERTGVRAVCLGGGVFVNRRLTTDLRDRLGRMRFDVYTGEQVPVGDGGISYGQAAIAAATLAEE
ncbi:carbamoyltransferase HypF [Planosporangium thailandense]|uniref:Carbamoyltransferase n=1 Tax=Planosporangium thailandense TaxID=765197 RepID=A0ABX0Y270_9ACTN|nr:carbamoyltransferase HypF [Planosporangium thailandense]